ncbi:FAD-binding oxidoreductase [Mycobacterium sp.]|uniref:FAD-binding oxidoreductase n=1 Tax=Mycobacterium sp. TaxID=1785 RepID=UPI003C7632B3
MTQTATTRADTELSAYDIVLVTTDGVESTIRCDADTTVLAAAEQAGMVLKSACQAGGCGACSAVLIGGHVEMGEHDPEVIEVPEPDGGILLCRSFPRGDCRIDLPYDRSTVVTAPPTHRPARITGLDQVAEGMMRVRLVLLDDAGGAASADFESGQFVRVTVPGTTARRTYSPANVANWDGELEFYIRLLPGGVMSDYLTETAAIGDVLTVTSPQGSFTMVENGLRPRWFIAGGTGLSPLLSMLRRMAEWGDPQPARLFFGVTRHTEVFARDELQAIAAALPDFRADTLVWQPDPQWTGATGNPVDVAAAEASKLSEWPDVYVCGPPPMIDAAYVRLKAVGMPHTQIHSERFCAAV